MASFGNSSASSLINAAQAAYNKQQSYNDSIASFQYDQSAKTQQDLAAYESYLQGRAKSTSDPSQQLSVQKTLASAYRSYNSAEISRLSTGVAYGDISNTDKYNQLVQLQQAAMSNGDYNLAQSLDAKRAALSVTIQNQAIAAGNAADRAGTAAQSARNKGYTAAQQQIMANKSKLDDRLQTGQITAAEYNVLAAALVQQTGQLYNQAASDPSLSDTAQASYADKANKFVTDKQNAQVISNAERSASGETPTALHFNENTKTYEVKQLDNKAPSLGFGPDGKLVTQANTGLTGTGAVDLTKSGSVLRNITTGGRGQIDPQTGQPITLSGEAQPVIRDYKVDLAGNAIISPDGLKNPEVLLAGANGNAPFAQVPQLDASLGTSNKQGYGLVKDKNGKYRMSTAADFANADKSKSNSNLLSRFATGADIFKQYGQEAIQALQGNKYLQALPGAGGVLGQLGKLTGLTGQLNTIKQQQAAAQAAAYQAQINQRNAASAAALASLPRANVSVPATVNSFGKVIGGVGAPAIPAATKKAQNTVGTDAFTKNLLGNIHL